MLPPALSPGAYVVIYSSCTLWTAIIAVATTDTRLNAGQWNGIALLTVGLLANGLENYSSKGADDNGSVCVCGRRACFGMLVYSFPFQFPGQWLRGKALIHFPYSMFVRARHEREASMPYTRPSRGYCQAPS